MYRFCVHVILLLIEIHKVWEMCLLAELAIKMKFVPCHYFYNWLGGVDGWERNRTTGELAGTSTREIKHSKKYFLFFTIFMQKWKAPAIFHSDLKFLKDSFCIQYSKQTYIGNFVYVSYFEHFGHWWVK